MKLKRQIWEVIQETRWTEFINRYWWKFRVSGSKEGVAPGFLVWWMVVPSAATINAARVHVYWVRCWILFWTFFFFLDLLNLRCQWIIHMENSNRQLDIWGLDEKSTVTQIWEPLAHGGKETPRVDILFSINIMFMINMNMLSIYWANSSRIKM